MTEFTDVLERARREFPAPQMPLDRVLRRRDRRRRNQRIAAATLAVAIAIAGIGYATRVLQFTNRPASITPDNVKELSVAWTASLSGSASGQQLRRLNHPKPGSYSAPLVFPPTVAGDTLYVSSGSGKLYAFPASCGASAAVCHPSWIGDAGGTIPWPPAVSDGVVYVATNRGELEAFPVDCGSGGSVCRPSWVGSIPDPPSSSPVVSGGIVYLLDHQPRSELFAFRTHCASGGRHCAPLWSAQAGPPFTRSGPTRPGKTLKHFLFAPVVADGAVYVIGTTHQLYAFDAATGVPLWVGLTDWQDIGGARFNEVEVADGEVFLEAGTTLYAFKEGCATGGAECRPLWTGARTNAFVMTEPVVANGVVYVGTALNGGTGHVEAFPTHCRSDGGECKPLWVARADGETTTWYPVVAGDRVYVTSAIRGFTDAFPVSCRQVCPLAWRAAPVAGYQQRGLSQLPLGSGDLVFVGNGTEIRAFDRSCGTGGATCSPLWTWTVPDGIASTPTVAGDELLVATSAGQIYAFTPGGVS